MELKQFVQGAVERHVAQSLAEMRDADKFDRWKNGTRAREQAEQIVHELVAEAQRILEQRSDDHAA